MKRFQVRGQGTRSSRKRALKEGGTEGDDGGEKCLEHVAQ
jgi:hypothetical protein